MVAPKEAANIYFVTGEFAQPHILRRGKMHLEIGAQGNVARMNLKAKPASAIRLRLRPATRGANHSLGKFVFAPAPARHQFAAEMLKGARQGLIQNVAREAKGAGG